MKLLPRAALLLRPGAVGPAGALEQQPLLLLEGQLPVEVDVVRGQLVEVALDEPHGQLALLGVPEDGGPGLPVLVPVALELGRHVLPVDLRRVVVDGVVVLVEDVVLTIEKRDAGGGGTESNVWCVLA